MKSKLFAVVGALLMASSVAYASPDRTGKVDAGFNVSAGFMEDSDTSAYFGGNIAYGVNNWLAVGFSGGWQEFGSELTNIGDLQAVPLFGDIIVRAQNPDNPVVPYGVLGLGAVLWDFEGANLPSGFSVEVEDSFATKIGAGVDYFVTDNVALNIEASYVFTDADTSVRTPAGSITESADADFWMIGGGVKFVF